MAPAQQQNAGPSAPNFKGIVFLHLNKITATVGTVASGEAGGASEDGLNHAAWRVAKSLEMLVKPYVDSQFDKDLEELRSKEGKEDYKVYLGSNEQSEKAYKEAMAKLGAIQLLLLRKGFLPDEDINEADVSDNPEQTAAGVEDPEGGG